MQKIVQMVMCIKATNASHMVRLGLTLFVFNLAHD